MGFNKKLYIMYREGYIGYNTTTNIKVFTNNHKFFAVFRAKCTAVKWRCAKIDRKMVENNRNSGKMTVLVIEIGR